MGVCKRVRGRRVWCAGCAVALCCGVALGAVPAKAKTAAAQRRAVEVSPWEQADGGREALEAIPEGSRTKADYTKAMDGFRAVYHDAPQGKHAAAAVYAVAELLAEQGHGLHDAKSLKAAVGQYEFLRTQYPGSSLRVGALLVQAQIYENDLHDAAAAKERYSLLVKQYPKSAQAEEARAGLASLEQEAGAGNREQRAGSREQGGGASGERTSGKASLNAAPVRGEDKVEGVSSFAPMPVTRAADGAVSQSRPLAGTTRSGASGGMKTAPATASNDVGTADRRGMAAPVDDAPEAQGAPVASAEPVKIARTAAKRPGGLAQVTGIRHWSSPDYTRVAIDLGDDVTYEAARVPNPDRIYFDLHGTRLAQELVGKSFAVTDDGFLKKIRAAQFSNDMTRVVLDVNDVTEYSAFLLPDPYRLIIDIHGGSKAEPGAPVVSVPMQRAAVATPTVPNTTAVKAGSSFDVAALSAQPGRVEATTQPTSQPISAVVKDAGAEG